MNISLFLPPLIGAFIGYMTNYVAIRMLFRPLRPWKLFGIRLPMTPGVIPSKREALADNIGEMVGGHLLSGDEVAAAIQKEGFQNELQRIIDARMASLTRKRMGTLRSLIPEDFISYFDRGMRILRWRLLKNMHNYMAGTDFINKIQSHISEQLQRCLDSKIDDLISSEKRKELSQVIENGLMGFGSSESTRRWLEDILQKKINTLIARDATLADIVPRQLQQLVGDLLAEQAPLLLSKGARLLHEPDVRQKLVTTICRAIDAFIASLGPIGVMAAGFLNPEKIERTITDYIENNQEEINDLLGQEVLQQKVAQLLRQGADKIFKTPISGLPIQLEEERRDIIIAEISRQVTDMILDPCLLRELSGKLTEALENQSDEKLILVVEQLWQRDEVDDLVELISKESVAIFQSDEMRHMIDTLVVELLEEKIMARPMGRIDDFIPHEVRQQMSGSIRKFVDELLVAEIPTVVDSLDIRQIVTRKVNSLDLLQLEQMLLGIMQEQFKYINLFGALLGFLIGCLNLFFLRLH